MMKCRTHILFVICCLFFCASKSLDAQDTKHAKDAAKHTVKDSKETKNGADTIVLHGRVYTLDAKQPWAQAVFV